MTDQKAPDHPGVVIPPPLIFGGFLLFGLWLDSAWFRGELAGTGWTLIGGIIALAGAVLLVLSAWRFKVTGTNIEPWKPDTAIIDDGLYAYSRNPIYLAMALGCAGLAIAAASLPALGATVLSIIVIRTYVIEREERYLERKFGADYLAYKARVRRWL